MTENNPAPSSLSPPSNELAQALIDFQAAVPTIHQNDSSFHGKFANLPGVLSTIGPALRANGLAVSQLPEDINGQPGLRTTLLHTSGQSLTAVTPLSVNAGKNGTQEWGKAMTYSRRYALQAVLGLCVGIEDNDADLEPETKSKPAAKPATKGRGIIRGDDPLEKEDVFQCLGLIKELEANPEKMKACISDFRDAFNLPGTAKLNETFTMVKHQTWLNENMSKYV
jgi:hypothetical protein